MSYSNWYESDIAVDYMFVDREHYQRPLAEYRVKNLTPFDRDVCPQLIVSRRADGRYAIIDGQHRWEAARRRGGVAHLPCKVYVGLTIEEEATLFRIHNKNRAPILTVEDWHARKGLGDDDVLAIESIAAAHGYTIATDKGRFSHRPGVITSVGALEAIYNNKSGAFWLDLTLDLINEAWPNEGKATSANILLGLSHFLRFAHDRPDFSMPMLRQHLKRTPVEEILKEATVLKTRSGGSGHAETRFYIVIGEVYNKGLHRHNKLPLEEGLVLSKTRGSVTPLPAKSATVHPVDLSATA